MNKLIKLLFFSFCILLNHENLNAQLFGNTNITGVGGYGGSQIVWIKIITGPSDSGVFTHYGIYDHPTYQTTCAIKFAIYSDTPSTDRPDALLAQDYLASPTNGVWNEKALLTPITITPNTVYWIGLRFPCTYGSGREVGVNWPNPPLRFKTSWSWIGNWPNPAGSVSTQGFLNNVGLYLIGNNQTMLPVEMLSFDINEKDSKAILSWETASETNNSGWNIQRSDNGFTWHNIDWVAGSINSNVINKYSYNDQLVKDGLTFYRLEQVDIDGRKAYSEVRNIDHITDKIILSPNPTSGLLYINKSMQEKKYRIFDAQGTFLLSDKILDDESINVENLSSGIYFIEIDGKPYRFMKK